MHRILPGSGILFAALIAAVVLTTKGNPPTNQEATAASVRAFYAEHGASARLHVFLFALAGLAVLGLAVHLHDLLRAPDPGPLPTLGLAGGIAVAATVWLLDFFTALPGTLPIDELDDTTVTTLYAFAIDGGELLVYVGSFALACFVGAFSLSAHRTRSLPRPLTWVGLASSILSALGSPVLLERFPEAQESAFSAPWFFGFLLFAVWVAAVGVSGVLRARNARELVLDVRPGALGQR